MTQSYSRPSKMGSIANDEDSFSDVIAAISEGKYSWACVLILKSAGYNPLHYMPYRTYNRIIKANLNLGKRQKRSSSSTQESNSKIRSSSQQKSADQKSMEQKATGQKYTERNHEQREQNKIRTCIKQSVRQGSEQSVRQGIRQNPGRGQAVVQTSMSISSRSVHRGLQSASQAPSTPSSIDPSSRAQSELLRDSDCNRCAPLAKIKDLSHLSSASEQSCQETKGAEVWLPSLFVSH